jgi:hypothetical protein
MRTLVLLGLTILSSLAQAATFRVGADGACTHTTLAAAVTAAAGNADTINTLLLANNASYTGVRVLLNNAKRLNIEGGYDSCSDSSSDAATPTILNALAGDSMFEVRLTGGAGLFLTTLIIQGGGDTDAGGGVEVRSGNTTLDNVQVRNNRARYGGGVYVDGLGAAIPARLQLGVNARPSFIYENTATTSSSIDGRGGGVHCGNNATLSIVSAQISDNTAVNGGGISADTGCNVQFAGLQPTFPPVIRNNTASSGAGGLWVDDAQVTTSNATRIFIDGNVARFSSAIQATNNANVQLRYAWIKGNRTTTADDVAIRVFNSQLFLRGGPLHVRCENNEFCSQVRNSAPNQAAIELNGAGSPGARLELERVHLSGFSAARPIIDTGSLASLVVSNSLITGNQSALGLIDPFRTDVRINYSTIVDNTAPATFRGNFSDGGTVALHASVLFDAAPLAVSDNLIAFSNGACPSVVSNNTNADSVGRVTTTSGLDANFIPTALGEAIDNCATEAAFAPDMQNNPRPVDFPIGDIAGPQDAGAFERQADVVDPIFRNGFE